MNLTYDNCFERKSNLQTVCNAGWKDIEAAITRMNARNHTEVFLEDGPQMSIGGGGGDYFVSIFTEDERSFVLADKAKPASEMVRLKSAGQLVSLPLQRVVDLEMTLRAARCFFERKAVDESLEWITD
jgi:hypothetical protein